MTIKNGSGTRRKKLSDDAASGDGAWWKHCLKGNIYDEYLRPLLAEFFGTLIFVFVGSMSSAASTAPGLAAVYPAVATGLILIALYVALGSISGCHLNPAVTSAVLVNGTMKFWLGMGYMVVQVVGGIIGAGLAGGLMGTAVFLFTNGGYPAAPESILKAVFIEGIVTFILVLIFIVCSLEKSPLTALAYGLAMFVGVLVTFYSSGGILNPSRAFGSAVIRSSIGLKHWKFHWVIYWIGPIIGADLAAIFYRFILAGPEHRALMKNKYTNFKDDGGKD